MDAMNQANASSSSIGNNASLSKSEGHYVICAVCPSSIQASPACVPLSPLLFPPEVPCSEHSRC